MIYTSYFAQMRNFPVNFIPIAICGGIPKWYNGLWYKKVAPKWAFFSQWKQTHDDEYYVEHFNREVLQSHEPQRFLNEIQLLVPEEIRAGMAEPVWQSKNVHVVLLCYEKRGDFCHRHLVSKWVNDWAGKDLIQEWIPEAVEERVIRKQNSPLPMAEKMAQLSKANEIRKYQKTVQAQIAAVTKSILTATKLGEFSTGALDLLPETIKHLEAHGYSVSERNKGAGDYVISWRKQYKVNPS